MKNSLLKLLTLALSITMLLPVNAAELTDNITLASDCDRIIEDNIDADCDSQSDYQYTDSEDYYYISAEPEESADMVNTQSAVSQDMCRYSYWRNKSAVEYSEVLMNQEEIEDFNIRALNAKGTNMNDLPSITVSYNAAKLRSSLAANTTNKETLYVDFKAVKAAEYYKEINDAILATAWEGTLSPKYAIAVRHADINTVPSNAYVGYSATDSDNEIVNSALLVNEPFVIKQYCEFRGHGYYWGYSENCTGWVDADNIAVCNSYDEWLDAFTLDKSAKDFIVVTEGKVVLEPSVYVPYSSEVKLTFGTILKMVPSEDIPEKIGERGTWNNYVVYLPTRNADGSYERRIALISQHYSITEGYLPLTQENILKVSYGCLGDRYGWGGMLDAMDCSMYTRNIYRCFGISLPRNTTWQQLVPDTSIDISAMTDEEKQQVIKTLPSGAMLYFPGHVMMYLGYDRDELYVISALGSVAESEGELAVKNIYSVAINSLNVRRKNGNTWLTNLAAIVCPFGTDMSRYKGSAGEDDPSGNDKPSGDIPSDNIKVPAAAYESYAAADDTLPLDTFYNSTRKLIIDLSKAKGASVSFNSISDNSIRATVLKGSKITTKEAVKAVTADKKACSVRFNKRSNTACITIKRSTEVVYTLMDGSEVKVLYNAESPKKSSKIALTMNAADIALNPYDIFGTRISAGRLSIVSAKGIDARAENNKLIIPGGKAGRIKVCYEYLGKKLSAAIRIR